MNLVKLSEELKRLEALVALALGRAVGAAQGNQGFIITGQSTAGAVPTTFTATIPVAPKGVSPATYVGLLQFDCAILGRTLTGNNWSCGRILLCAYNNAGTLDLGDTTGTFPSANPAQLQVAQSTAMVVAGGVTLTPGTSGGNITLGLRAPTLAGGPTVQWTVYYQPRVAT